MKSDDVYLWSQITGNAVVTTTGPVIVSTVGAPEHCVHNLELVICDHKEDPAREACVHMLYNMGLEHVFMIQLRVESSPRFWGDAKP